MKRASADPVAEIMRDIAAARAELKGRCDQLVAECEERLGVLETVEAQVAAGELGVRAAQAKVRQLLHERGKLTTVRAGRTTIGSGMAGPAAPVPAPQRLAPTSTLAEATVSKMLQTIDVRIVAIISQARALSQAGEGRLELSLLLQERRSLQRVADDPPKDPVLLAAVMEQTEEVGGLLAELEGGGVKRLLRLVAHARQLASQLVALGGATAAAPVKELINSARVLLADQPPKLEQATTQAATAFRRLQEELDRRHPLATPTLLDELLRL